MATVKQYERLLSNYDEHCRRIAKATYLNVGETEREKLARIKKLEANYVKWFEYYFPNYAKVQCAWFHNDFARDIISHTEWYELLEIYRSGAKSVHSDMGIPLYLMFARHDLHFMLLIGETEKKAQKLLSSLQSQIQYNKRLINDYGTKYKFGDWSDGAFMTTDGVRFMSLGFGQNPRGLREEDERPDYIVVDDVDNKRHVNNDRLMREGVEWIFEDLMGCFDETDGSTKRFVFANNNFHKNSITNRLKRQFTALAGKAVSEGKKPIHKVLTVRAVKDLSSFEPNWPEKTSAAYWKDKFANTPYRSFMREYMHTHVEDGKVFRMEDMQWKQMLPLRQYDALIFYGDLSYKATACFKGMILIGKTGREFHIIHTFLRQSTRVSLARWLYDIYEQAGLQHVPKIKYYIEGFFSMDDFVNDFDEEGDRRGYHIPIRADKRPKGDKYDRIEATQSFFERRNVFFNEAERNTADQIELVDQYLAFEKGGDAAVDGPDAAEGAFSKLNAVSKRQKTAFRSTARISRRY